MPSQLTDPTGDGAPRLAAIELRYELAKARIAGVAVPTGNGGPVHDTVAVDVATTRPPLIPAGRRTDGTPDTVSPASAEAPARGRRLWRSLRLPRLVGRSLPAS